MLLDTKRTSWGEVPLRGHLRKRGDRSWAVVLDIGYDPKTGKRRQKWVSVKGTKRDAERRLAEVVSQLDAGTYVEPARITLAGYLNQWMDDYVATSVRPRTALGYASIVRSLQEALGRIGLTALKPQHVQRYYVDMLNRGLSAQTVLHHHRVLFQALRQAVRWDMLALNIMERVTPPRRTKPELRILTIEESLRLLDAAAGTDYHLPIHLAIYTGLRRSEILGLRWPDVDLDSQTLTILRTMVELPGNPTHLDEPKSRGSYRVVSYGPATELLLRAQWQQPLPRHNEQVCRRDNGTTLHPNVLSAGYKRIAAIASIDGVRFHDLRHTHASWLLAAGVPVHVVQARLGHGSISTTVDIYGHVLPASDAQAGAVIEQTLRLQNVCKRDKPEP